MNTNDLLEVAIGTGKRNTFIPDNVDVVYYGMPSSLVLFNPTIGDLILWLMDRGHLDLYNIVEVSFRTANENYYLQAEVNLKENLLEIIFQVIRAEKEK